MAERKTARPKKTKVAAKRTPVALKKTASKKRKLATKKTAKKPAVQIPAVTASTIPDQTPALSIPVVIPTTPSTLTIPEPNYKTVHTTAPQRFKLWLTVGLSMAVIVCIWAYSLSQSLLHSTALQDSSKALELDTMMEDVGGSLSDLKDQTDSFIQQTENKNSNTNTNTPDPSNQQLDNLFSDIQ